MADKYSCVKRPKSVDILDRMLNHTTLTTQRITHNHILAVGQVSLLRRFDIGQNFVKTSTIDIASIQKRAAQEARDAAERRHVKELNAALQRQQKEMEDDKLRCLKNQKLFYDDLAKRVTIQKERAEEERIKQLRRQFEKEKEQALKIQWEKAETIKEQAVEGAIGSLRKKMKDEYALEKEKAIAETLTSAREKFREREQEAINRTRYKCQKEAAEEAERVVSVHKQEVARLNNRLTTLQHKLDAEANRLKIVEGDYAELEEDYRRFLDYTNGMFHSDYMMQLRLHGAKTKHLVKGSSKTEQPKVFNKYKDHPQVILDFRDLNSCNT